MTTRTIYTLILGFLAFIRSVDVIADDVWFIDTRSAQVTPDGKIGFLSVEKLSSTPDSSKQWMPSSLDEFLRTHDPEKPMVIMIHGNLMPRPEARSHGLAFYRYSRKIGDHRLVVWCWPSEKQYCRIRPDAQTKAIRADTQGPCLAAFLREFGSAKPNSKVSILGFSYGAKVMCKALDILGREQESSERGNNALRIRPILLAAAMDRSSLAPRHNYGHALDMVDEMLIHVNRNDKTLRFYPLLFRLHGPQAIGKEGVSLAGVSPENRRKVKSVRVDHLIGEDHGFMKSLFGIIACENDFRHYVLFE